MVVSGIIISLSLSKKLYSFPLHNIVDLFQTGAAVFGMLSFGLTGLIQTMMNDSID